MNLYRYKSLRVLLMFIIVIMFSLSFMLKLNLYKLKKTQSTESNFNESNKNSEKIESVSLYNLIEVLQERDLFNLEEINIQNECKEVTLSCDKDINIIKKNLKDLKNMSLVKDIIKIDYNNKLWIITVIFN